jgi:hypothetical protein
MTRLLILTCLALLALATPASAYFLTQGEVATYSVIAPSYFPNLPYAEFTFGPFSSPDSVVHVSTPFDWTFHDPAGGYVPTGDVYWPWNYPNPTFTIEAVVGTIDVGPILEFGELPGGPDYAAEATFVGITGGASAVPAPPSFILFATGLLMLGGFAFKESKPLWRS